MINKNKTFKKYFIKKNARTPKTWKIVLRKTLRKHI